MGRRRKNSPSSSLELLLDTMCNTFGGVMFIAISLTVIASMMTPQASTESQSQAVKNAAELRTEIASLQDTLEALKMRRSAKEDILRRFGDDPRLALLTQITEAEESLKHLTVQTQLQSLADSQLRNENALLTLILDSPRRILAELQNRQTALSEHQRLTEKELQSLKTQMKSQMVVRRIVFKKLQPVTDQSAPYFMLISRDRLYHIGPLDPVNPEKTIHSDVLSLSVSGFIQCEPKSGTVLAINDRLVPSALSSLRLPADRFLSFQVSPESANTFYQLANELKKQQIPYRWSAIFPGNEAGFAISSEAEYER